MLKLQEGGEVNFMNVEGPGAIREGVGGRGAGQEGVCREEWGGEATYFLAV